MIYLMTTLYAIKGIPGHEQYMRDIDGLITKPLGRPFVCIRILGEDSFWTFFQSDRDNIEELERNIRSKLGCTLDRIIPIVKSEIAKAAIMVGISKKEWPILYFLFGTRQAFDFHAMKASIYEIYPKERGEIILAEVEHPRYNFLAALSGSGMGEIGTQLQHILNIMNPEHFSIKMGAEHGWCGNRLTTSHDERIGLVAQYWSEDQSARYIEERKRELVAQE